MKTLIVYYSFTGNNEFLAKELQERLKADTCRITELKHRTNFTMFLDAVFSRKPKIQPPGIRIDQYDHIILMAPIWFGKIAGPLKSFIRMEKDHFNAWSFITICGGGTGQKEKITAELTALVQKPPVIVSELRLSDILPADTKNKTQGVTGYRIAKKDLPAFEETITGFVQAVLYQPVPVKKNLTVQP